MSKKHFIALADKIKYVKAYYPTLGFRQREIEFLADFCQSQNARFNRARWLAYIAGTCGPNGGKVKA